MKKRGVSPVITTVLLVSIVVVLAAIIFLWARGFVTEVVEKEIAGVKKSADKYCSEINLEAYFDSGNILYLNKGNIPIYRVDIKEIMPGNSKISTMLINLDSGESVEKEFSKGSTTTSIKVIPVLLGKSGDKTKEYTCDDDFAVDVVL